eukprot:1273770-Pyramimonas_sp.AAC.1
MHASVTVDVENEPRHAIVPLAPVVRASSGPSAQGSSAVLVLAMRFVVKREYFPVGGARKVAVHETDRPLRPRPGVHNKVDQRVLPGPWAGARCMH